MPSESAATFENRNPANPGLDRRISPTRRRRTPRRRSAAAKRAFDTWRLVPAPKRAEILFQAGELIAARKEEFARDMTREMGKVLEETRGDVQEAID